MRRAVRTSVAVAAAVVWIGAGIAGAAPVERPADLKLTIDVLGIRSITVTGSDSIAVDESASTLRIPAGAVALTSEVILPVTATTAAFSITASTISNQSATLAPGAAADISDEPPCPANPGEACVAQTGFGGAMGLNGTIGVGLPIDPAYFTLEIDLDRYGIGQAGATNSPFSVDAAPWTTRTGSADGGGSSTRLRGTISVAGSRFTLVTPTFVSAFGTLRPLHASFEVTFTDGQGLPTFMPEPAALLAIGATLGALALIGRRRR